MASKKLRRELLEAARSLHERDRLDQETMNNLEAEPRAARVATAPAPVLYGAAGLPPNRVTAVVLTEGEDARWIWTHTPDGRSYVSGYSIVRRGARRISHRPSRAKPL